MSTDPAAGVGVLAALWAGMVSFLSPCVLPLVPGYLSAVTGVSVTELEDSDWRRVLVPSLLFVASSAGRGAFLLAVYSAGLAIPFLLTALAFSRMTTAFDVVKRHYPVIIASGGVILIAMGVLIWTGEFFHLNIEAQKLLDRLGLDF